MTDTIKLIVEFPKDLVLKGFENRFTEDEKNILIRAIGNGTPLTSQVLAYALMEERIKGEFNTDTTFEKDIIHDVKCRLTVSIIDHRPCYCGAELREVWRESEDKNEKRIGL